MAGPVFLEGERVTLHPVEDADADFLARLIDHPDVRGGLAHVEPMTAAQERDWIETVADSEDAHFVAPDHQGRGYATDAVGQVVEYGFAERRLNRIAADAFAFNDASQRVLEKVGFEREGVGREAAFVDGEYVDVYRYGILAREWSAGS